MIDGRGQRSVRSGTFCTQRSNRLRNGQNKDRSGQRGGMIMRSAAVVVLRAAIVMVGMSVGMGDALGVRRDLPMLISVNPLRHGQQRKADQP